MLLSPLLELWIVHVMPNLRAIMLDLVTVSELLLAPLLCPGTTVTVLILSIYLIYLLQMLPKLLVCSPTMSFPQFPQFLSTFCVSMPIL